MLRLAVEYSRKPPRARSDLAARIAVLGDEVERRLGDAGRIERESQEAFLLSHLGSAESCKDLLFRASGDRVFLCGCRFRYARTLADAGKATEAAEQYRLAIKEMVWARFAYAEFVPTALLERAKALLASGDSATAREVFCKVVSNFAGADRELSEVIAAREALAGLAK